MLEPGEQLEVCGVSPRRAQSLHPPASCAKLKVPDTNTNTCQAREVSGTGAVGQGQENRADESSGCLCNISFCKCCSDTTGSLGSLLWSLPSAPERTCSGLVEGSVFLPRRALCRASFSTWMALSTAEASSSRSSASCTGFRVAERGLSRRLPGPAGGNGVCL